jgi:hypothetical protein
MALASPVAAAFSYHSRARPSPLWRFVAIWGIAPGADCFSISTALFDGLSSAENLVEHVWYWVSADLPSIGEHHYLVAADDASVMEGWMVDASHGSRRPVITMRHDAYRAMRGAVDLRIVATVGGVPTGINPRPGSPSRSHLIGK